MYIIILYLLNCLYHEFIVYSYHYTIILALSSFIYGTLETIKLNLLNYKINNNN